MNLDKLSIFNVDTIGVYCFTNNKYTLIPTGLSPEVKSKIREVLATEVLEVHVAGTSLLGIMVAGNNNGILLPRNVKEEELREMKKLDLKVSVLNSKSTALGNVILCNDKGAIVYPEMEKDSIKTIKEVLEVEELSSATIADVITVGSVAVVTNKGALVHVDASDKDIKVLSNLLKVKVEVGTVNFGSPFIKSGVLANDKGIIVGTSTTGPEIVRIQRALGD
jgi:translation initiation factor 6